MSNVPDFVAADGRTLCGKRGCCEWMGVPSVVGKMKRGVCVYVCVCVCVCVLATIDSVPGASDYRSNYAELQWLSDNNLVTTYLRSTSRLLLFANQPAK